MTGVEGFGVGGFHQGYPYLFKPEASQSKPEEVVETVVPPHDSSGKLSEEAVQRDRLAQQKVFNQCPINGDPPPPLSKSFLKNMHLHNKVESAPMVTRLRESPPAKEEYQQYLIDLHWGLYEAEKLFENTDFKGKNQLNFHPFFRAEKLARDIENLNQEAVLPNKATTLHPIHYQKLAQTTPYLLVAHLSLRYLAILHGGQQRAERLQKDWGKQTPVELYSFDQNSKDSIQELNRQLDAFGKVLSPGERARFDEEILTAWYFAGDIVGINVRPT